MTLLLPDAPPGRRGVQAPRVSTHPGTAVASSAADVEGLCSDAGFVLDEWQVGALEVILGERVDGKWAARDAAFLVARQNGKGGILHALDLAGLFLFDDVKEILHSAHEHKTAKKAYRELREIIKAAPHLYAQVERRGNRVVGFRQSNEDTSITLADGSVIRFIARSRTSARGFSPQMVIMDEAQECSFDTRDALNYTLRAQPNPLIAWCGTVPTDENNGEVFTWLRDRGRAGGSKGLSWQEWSPPEGCDLRSDEAILWANPGLGYRITWETLELERDDAVSNDLVWAGWCREALSHWPDGKLVARWEIVAGTDWIGCGTQETKPKPGWITDPVYVVEMPQSRSHIAVGAAGPCREGGIGGQLMSYGPAGPWLVKYLTDEKITKVGIDKGGPAATEIETLRDAGIEVHEFSYDDLKKATGDFHDAVRDGEFRHRNQPELDAAVANARKRNAGDVWLIDRRSDHDSSPANAVALAAAWAKQPDTPAYAIAVYA